MEAIAKPTHLYHYTTAEGLKGIVERQELWATDIFHLNDWTEFWRGRNILGEALKKKLASMKDNTREASVAREVVKLLEELNPPHTGIFVCSFSDAKGGDDLSQWRGYCPRGGYSIGLGRERLEYLSLGHRSDHPEHAGCDRNCFFLEQCRYADDAEDLCQRLLAFVDEVSGREEYAVSSVAAKLVLGRLAAVYKDPGFRDENEWRLICARTKPRLSCRRSGTSLIYYTIFCLHDPDLWEDVRIVVSPDIRESNERREQSVKAFLRSTLKEKGLPTTCVDNVRLSNIPYRAGVGG